ncbi:uncharacterized protein LOC134668248 [Cydia fagiglandana]|uniref:uncharacterized protein LOC134668248 n=1 Tax=Cydia fagiglandana TaxID=1458189 RepID=UPI002FEE00BD
MPDPCPGCQPTKATERYQRQLSKEEKKCEKENEKALNKYEKQLAKFERERQRKLNQLEKMYISKLEDELVGTGDLSGSPSLVGAPPGDSGDPFYPCCCSGAENTYKSNDPILDRRQDTSNIISIFVKPEQLGLDVKRKPCQCGTKSCSLRKQLCQVCYRYCCYFLTVCAAISIAATIFILFFK